MDCHCNKSLGSFHLDDIYKCFQCFKKKNHSTFESRIRIVLGSVFIAFTHVVTSVSGHVPEVTMSVWDESSSAGFGGANPAFLALLG